MSFSHPTPGAPALVDVTHRQRIARIVSGLRPVRPRVPFYRLAAHRVPTLWVLYRGLLRASPNPNVRHAHARFLPRSLTRPRSARIYKHSSADTVISQVRCSRRSSLRKDTECAFVSQACLTCLCSRSPWTVARRIFQSQARRRTSKCCSRAIRTPHRCSER
jgi:hypothetical protein